MTLGEPCTMAILRSAPDKMYRSQIMCFSSAIADEPLTSLLLARNSSLAGSAARFQGTERGGQMSGVLSATAISFDRLCEHVAAAIYSSEPQIYGAVLVAILVGYLTFPPKNDPDQI